jgi:elongation factor P
MKASEIRKGVVVFVDGAPCRVMDFQHRTPGNLRAFVQVRLRNLLSGNTFDTRFSSTENVETARLDTKELQVLYRDANGVHVMDASTYEQYSLDNDIVGEAGPWMEPEMVFQAEWLEGRPIGITLPAVIELEIVETTPPMRGATKTSSGKPAKLSNGVTITVPEFVEEGSRVKVDPRSGQYLERAK